MLIGLFLLICILVIFNGNWNVDGDSLYGEFESSEMYTMDYAPEIFVG